MLVTIIVLATLQHPACLGRTLEEAVGDYAAMTQRMNVEGIAGTFVPSGVLSHTGGEKVVGPAAISAFLQKFADYKITSDRMTVSDIRQERDAWVTEGAFVQAVTTPTGQQVTASGHFSARWICDASKWRLRALETS